MRKQQRRTQTAAVRMLTEPQLRLNGNNRTRKRNRIGIAPLPLTQVKPLLTLNRAKETRKRNRSETDSQLPIQTSNSNKQCGIAKNCARSCCNNSTSFSPLVTPLVV